MLRKRTRTLLLTVFFVVLAALTLGRTVQQISTPELYVCAWLGSSDCQGWLGYRLEQEGDFRKAEYWHKKAARSGFTPSQIALGTLYLKGEEWVPANNFQAFYWYNKAVESGRRDANLLYMVGKMMLAGEGTDQRIYEGWEWITKAALMGQPQAQHHLVQLHLSDDVAIANVIPQDAPLAIAWLRRAKETVPRDTELFKALLEETKRVDKLITKKDIADSELEYQLIGQNMLRQKIDLPQN